MGLSDLRMEEDVKGEPSKVDSLDQNQSPKKVYNAERFRNAIVSRITHRGQLYQPQHLALRPWILMIHRYR